MKAVLPTFEGLFSSGHSKQITNHVLDCIHKDAGRMEELMDCFFHEDLRICQRSAWAVGMIADKNAILLEPYLEKMIHNLDRPHHDAIVRNTFRALQYMEVPEEYEGLVFDKAFDFLLDPQQAVGIRVFAMTVCGNIAKKYKELKEELIPVIEEQLPFGSAGFISRGRRVINFLNQPIQKPIN